MLIDPPQKARADRGAAAVAAVLMMSLVFLFNNTQTHAANFLCPAILFSVCKYIRQRNLYPCFAPAGVMCVRFLYESSHLVVVRGLGTRKRIARSLFVFYAY